MYHLSGQRILAQVAKSIIDEGEDVFVKNETQRIIADAPKKAKELNLSGQNAKSYINGCRGGSGFCGNL